MIAGVSKAINQYLAPLLLLTTLLLAVFAYLAPNVMLATQVALLTVTPSTALTQVAGNASSVDGPSVFLGPLGMFMDLESLDATEATLKAPVRERATKPA